MSTNKRKPKRRRVIRKLVFDSLESRRLLAGVDVFVFDDPNNSGVFSPETDSPLAEQVVFIDTNNNGAFDSEEPWSLTDESGVATFDSLQPGEITPRLLGNNRSQLQTSPLAPADSGNLVADSNGFVAWHVDSAFWRFDNNILSLVDIDTGVAVVEHALPESVSNISISENRAVGISDDGADNSLVSIDLDSGNVTPVIGSTNRNWIETTVIDGKLIARSSAIINGSNLLEVVNSQSNGPSLSVIERAVVNAAADLSVSETAGVFAVAEAATNVSVAHSDVALFQIRDDGGGLQASEIGSRRFTGQVENIVIAPDSQIIAAQLASGTVRVVAANSLLGDIAQLPDTGVPLGFDSTRRLLFTSGEDGSLQAWSTANYELSYSLQLADASANEIDAAVLSAVTSPEANKLSFLTSAGLYTHDLARRASQPVSVNNTERRRVSIGLKTLRSNAAPELGLPDALTLVEDSVAQLDGSELNSIASDADGDEIYFFVTGESENSVVQINPLGEGTYSPGENFEGLDEFTVRAFDGRTWSEELTFVVHVAAVNDAPTGITADFNSIPENSSGSVDVGQIQVHDVDADADYQFFVNDTRFFAFENRIILGDSSDLDFETNPTIELNVTAVDRSGSGDSIEQSVTISVADTNDAPTDFVLDNLSVNENESNAVVGEFSIIDQDADDSHSVLLSDPRFVAEGNQLRLRDGALDYETESEIPVTITVIDQGGQQDSISRDVVITVVDQNDPTTGIQLTEYSIIERVRGFQVGRIGIVDQDAGEDFNVLVNDPRFEVVNGFLKLKDGIEVSRTVDGDTIPIRVTATSQQNGSQIGQDFILRVGANPSPWRNPKNPLDVNNDGRVTPLDPLIIINHINEAGIHPLTGSPDPEGEGAGRIYVDVNGDDRVTPQDVLIVINQINGSRVGAGAGAGESQEQQRPEDPPEGEFQGDLNESQVEQERQQRVRDVSIAAYLAELALREIESGKQE